ncbi:hypothetical protein B0H19DRAFT_151469 [Mycena capillaripes]|nr:hypothetical protein B0H19DRAFT_151469 [Mycena capillaripes]
MTPARQAAIDMALFQLVICAALPFAFLSNPWLINIALATDNYGNMEPAKAMHSIVFRYARDSWVRNIRTFMTGSHPIATEAARYLQIQDNYFDGSWNKGAGGNGYVRGSQVWDSLYYNNTLRNLRHFTFQWCAMRNVATMQNMTNDMNMHGGYEGHNLLELNFVSVPYSHRAGSSARTKFGTSALALLTSTGADGIDIEWAPCIGTTCISATQFSTIATTVKTGLGTKLLSLSIPTAFWSLSGLNTITTGLSKIRKSHISLDHRR